MHHITSIENLESILTNGILARNMNKSFYVDTADLSIINQREVKKIHNRPLSDYVPFHFDSFQINNGISYNFEILRKNGKENMVFLNVKVDKIRHRKDIGYFLSHPTSMDSKDFVDFEEYEKAFFTRYGILMDKISQKFNYSDRRVQNFFMSEILIPNLVEVDLIDKIIVFNEFVKQRVECIIVKKGLEIEVEIRPSFLGEK